MAALYTSTADTSGVPLPDGRGVVLVLELLQALGLAGGQLHRELGLPFLLAQHVAGGFGFRQVRLGDARVQLRQHGALLDALALDDGLAPRVTEDRHHPALDSGADTRRVVGHGHGGADQLGPLFEGAEQRGLPLDHRGGAFSAPGRIDRAHPRTGPTARNRLEKARRGMMNSRRCGCKRGKSSSRTVCRCLAMYRGRPEMAMKRR